jgi:Flp pilus assembly protein TadG
VSRLHLRRRSLRNGPARQHGVVAIVVGLMLAVLVGFIGLALDGGHLYLTKTELQNAADACALAASYELTGSPAIAAAAFDRADAAGRTVAQLNRFNFQGAAIGAADISVAFGTALSAGSTWVAAGAAPANAKYVRCTIDRNASNGRGIAPYFMQVLGFGATTVSSLATATLSPAQSNCAVPMALCTRGAAPNYGYTAGDWVPMDFSQAGGGSTSYTGNFRWIDFDPSAPTPGCSGGGAQELSCLMAGTGQCSLPSPITGSCSTTGSAHPTTGCVGQTGAINSLDKAYNTRFGVYAPGGGYSITNSPPDYTGNSYSTENWTLGRNAYAGTVTGQTNFQGSRANFLAITNPAGVAPAFYANNDTLATHAQHVSNGADRRLVVVPIVDCAGFASGQHAPVRAYSCVLLLDPYRRQGNNVMSRMEFLGLSNVAGSPCATSGIAGDSTSQGPMVPALVQ